MSMGMSMNFGMSQSMSMNQSLEMRVEQIQNVAAAIAGSLVPPSKEVDWPAVVEQVASQFSRVYRDQMRTALLTLTPDYFSNAQKVALQEPQAAESVAHKYVFRESIQKNGGGIAYTLEGNNAETFVHVREANFFDALTKPDELTEAATRLESLIGNSGANDQGLLEQINEYRDALIAANLLGTQFNDLTSLVRSAEKVTGDDGRPVIPFFFRDVELLKDLSFLVSDRLIRRFASRFAQVSPRAKEGEHGIAFCNVISEYLLMSMGILTEDLFSLKKGDLDAEEFEELKDTLKNDFGVDADELAAKFNINAGPYFFNRYSVAGVKHTKITDGYIRSFITAGCRQYMPQLLVAGHFSDLLAATQNVNTENKDYAERKAALRELAVGHFENPKICDGLQQVVRNDLYPMFVKLRQKVQGKKK